MKVKDPNFNILIFEKKVNEHISIGYSKELAEWKVLLDYHTYINKKGDFCQRSKKTNKEGYFINNLKL